MKKINFLLGVAAVASTAFLTSCFSSDGSDETPSAPQVDVEVPEVPYVIQLPYATVNGQVADDINVDYSPKSGLKEGTVVTFTATAEQAGVYTTDVQTKKITLGSNKNIASVVFQFTVKPVTVELAESVSEIIAAIPGVEEGTAITDIEDEVLAELEPIVIYQGAEISETGASTTVTDETGAANTVVIEEGDEDEAPITVGKVEMSVPMTAIKDAVSQSADNTAAFSIVVAKANDEKVDQIPVEQVEDLQDNTSAEKPQEVSTLSLVCEPSGVTFTKPVTVKISVPQSDGLDVKGVNGDDEINVAAEGDYITADIPHFSVWDFVLRADVQNYKVSETTTTKTMSVTAGENPITYESTHSWKATSSNALVTTYLKALIGSSKKVTSKVSASFKSSGNGKVTYRVISKKAEFDVVSGKKTIHVTAEIGSSLDPKFEVVYEQPGHSGGNAQ